MDKRPELTREQLQLIYDNTSDLVFLIAVEGPDRYRVEHVNPAYLARTGLGAEEIVGRRLEEVLAPEQADYVRDQYGRAIDGRRPYAYETRVPLRGDATYLDTTLVPVFGDDGACSHLIGVSRDVTGNKRERQALAQEKRRAENYLDIAEALIVALDTDMRITMLNRKGYGLLGYPEGSLTGRNWCEVCITPEKRSAFERGFRSFIERGEADRNINYVLTRSGERRLINWANAIIRDENGRITGLLSSGEDISDRKRAEQALIASQRVLAADEVVSGVAHDFNNALQGVLGNIELALAHSDTERFREHLHSAAKLADDAARRLRSLRGPSNARQDESAERLEVNEIVEDAIAQTRPLWKDEAQRHGRSISLTPRLAQPSPVVEGNRSELRTVLYNVIKNAIEAIGELGEILVASEQKDGHAVITVRDDGVGMDSRTSTRVFQPFFSTKGLEAGRGLGMSAAHSIVRAHRGDIMVRETSPGQGTVIEIRLPLAGTARADAASPGTRNRTGAPGRILWVDDDADIRALAESYLGAIGHEGDVVESGQQALAMLDGNDYAAVITDVGMPGMNGLDLARHIAVRPGPRPPVIAVTGWGDAISEDGRLPEGVAAVMSKPVRLQQIREILDDLPDPEGG